MDNRRLDITSDKSTHLRAALEVLVGSAPGSMVTHYLDITTLQTEPGQRRQPRTLVLLWSDEGGKARPLPTPLDSDGAHELAVRWLEALKPEERDSAIDMDGDCSPCGFRVFNEEWGHVLGMRYGVVGIQGVHAWYGK